MSRTVASQPPTSANVVLGTAAVGSGADSTAGLLAAGRLPEEVGEGARLPFRESEDGKVQRVALGRFQGFIKSFLGSTDGRWAILQLQCSQAIFTLQKELPRKSTQNL